MNMQAVLACLPFVGVAERGADNKPTRMIVPAFAKKPRSDFRFASVGIRREGNIFHLDCRLCLFSDSCEPIPCEGMANGMLCYHAIAAVMAAASDYGTIRFDKCNGHAIVLRAAYGSASEVVATYCPKVSGKPVETPAKGQVKQESSKLAYPRCDDACTCGKKLATDDEREKGLCPSCDQSTPRPLGNTVPAPSGRKRAR